MSFLVRCRVYRYEIFRGLGVKTRVLSYAVPFEFVVSTIMEEAKEYARRGLPHPSTFD